ncbi:hypothetical protein B484DRAFT_447069 [Ochromonadaceae sp. CCMP2298]|nr:hypothetical protein B484DRAFT_447069 [Ochromonadaceae sp. CCMP2298]
MHFAGLHTAVLRPSAAPVSGDRRARTKQPRRSFRASAAARKEDFYKTLGLSKGCTKAEVKSKFREMAKKYHPDLNKNDKNAAQMFQAASEAHEVLGDDEKRKLYDSYGHSGVDPNFQGGGGGNPFQGGGNPFGGFGGFGGFRGGQMNAEDLQDIFEQAMGGGGRGEGQDVQAGLKLTFQEAVRGCTKEVKFEYMLKEPVPGSGGNGRRTQYRKVRKSRSVKVDIPPGVDTGTQMRVQRQGAEGSPGYAPGDLFLQLEVGGDAYFKRAENSFDVNVEVAISLAQAVLGGSVDVLTLDGTVTMKVPVGTQPDDVLVLRGKGVRHVQQPTQKGSQYVKLKVQIPKRPTERQRQLIQEFCEPGSTDLFKVKPIQSTSDGSSTGAGSSSTKEPASPKDGGGVEGEGGSVIDQAWKLGKKFWGAGSEGSTDKGTSSSAEPAEKGAEGAEGSTTKASA